MTAAEWTRIDEGKRMEDVVRAYTDACNRGDRERVIGCFVEDAVNYFPPGMYGGPFRGASVIADQMLAVLSALGSHFTIDTIMTDVGTGRAVCEWTHFKTKRGVVLRGSDWIEFDRQRGLMKEIRVYYASPQAESMKRLELEGFDYQGRGYPVHPPAGDR